MVEEGEQSKGREPWALSCGAGLFAQPARGHRGLGGHPLECCACLSFGGSSLAFVSAAFGGTCNGGVVENVKWEVGGEGLTWGAEPSQLDGRREHVQRREGAIR